jgi:hypothetical protein
MTSCVFPAFPVPLQLPGGYGLRCEGVAAMVLIAGLYAVTLWLALLAYCVILGASVLPVLLLAPVLISGFVALLLGLDLLVSLLGGLLGRAARWVWRSLATVRLWRWVRPGAGPENRPL